MSSSSVTPVRKVSAAGIGGAVSVIVVYVVEAATGLDIPAEVAAAFAALVSFGAGYFVKE